MRKTAIKMFILGVAVLALFGAAVNLKNGYAKSGISEKELQKIDAKVEAWFKQASTALEEAGVPHSNDEDANDKNAAALGESVSVPMRASGANPLPWVVVSLGVVAGSSLVFMAFRRQYRTAVREASVGEMIDRIVAKNTQGHSRAKGERRMSKTRMHGDDEFDEISRAVDEIVAKYNKQDD